MLEGQRLEQAAVPPGLGPRLLDRTAALGRRGLAIDTPPQVQGPRLAVHHHLVLEFDDQGVEMDNVPLDDALPLENDLGLVVAGGLDEPDRRQQAAVLIPLGEDLGVADLVLVSRVIASRRCSREQLVDSGARR
jgi:hypothetical protein